MLHNFRWYLLCRSCWTLFHCLHDI